MKACLVGIAKNEGRFMFEWILYHAFGGFDAVVLYDNNSTDDTVAEAHRAARFADVRVIDWPLHPGQIQAYNDALTRLGAEFDVFCMLDIDEFLVPTGPLGIRDVLAMTDGHPLTAVNWMMYGSNGHVARPQGLVTELYTRRSEAPNNHVKTIVRPGESGTRFMNPHFMQPGDYVDLRGVPIIWGDRYGLGGKTWLPVCTDIARINHYHTKSREDYEAKIARGRATTRGKRTPWFDWHTEKENIVEDAIIPERFGPILDRIKAAAT